MYWAVVYPGYYLAVKNGKYAYFQEKYAIAISKRDF